MDGSSVRWVEIWMTWNLLTSSFLGGESQPSKQKAQHSNQTQGSFGFLPKIGQKTQAAPKSLALDWTLDCRIIASFRAHGGILADEILGLD